ncbi:MAG TPA: UMP kinase [Limnochordia bacterium]|nr:UMP kinase [Limnochordia bacterium]
MHYKRVLLKLSGEAVAGEQDFGFSSSAIEHIADQVLSLHEAGVEVALVVGGGNIFRGDLGARWGIERAEADNIGMMATVINSLMLRGVLQSRGKLGAADVRVMSAIPMHTVAEPFIRLRAIHHLEKGFIVIFAAGSGNPFVTTDYPAVMRAIEIRAQAILFAKNGVDGVYNADPKKDAAAKRYLNVDYNTVIRENLKALDQSAVILARDHKLPIHVFDFDQSDAALAICRGERVGTFIQETSDVKLG